MEGGAEAYLRRSHAVRGVIPAIEAGFMQREIADSAFRHQQDLEQKRRLIVGVNEFFADQDEELEILRIPLSLEQEQVDRLREVRQSRDAARASRALEQVSEAAASPDENLMPHILDAVRAFCTEGEIMGAMVDVPALYTVKAII